MKFTVTSKIKVNSEKVWKVFAHEFDSAYKWMASVPQSYA